MKKSAFITFEGPEGCGKSTQSTRLVDRLRKAGRDVIATREPGGTKLGELIRRMLKDSDADYGMSVKAEILLFEASRAELVAQVIMPALEAGKCVICDRFTDSTVAYQGYGRGFDMESLVRLNDIATGGLAPDLTILLDIDFEDGFERIEKRGIEKNAGLDRMEKEGRIFHDKVRQGYIEMALKQPSRFAVVDGSGDADDVEKAIWAVVADRIKLNDEN